MKYAYYPGCSLSGTAKEYDVASRALFDALGVELAEIPDWTCCGASAVEPTDKDLSLLLPARNLALAERHTGDADVMIPCSGCYLNLLKVDQKIRQDKSLLPFINEALAEVDLTYSGKARPRHILDVLINDIGVETLANKVESPFTDMTIAPYYGCQILRPYPLFDDPERPSSMDGLLKAVGADVLEWNMGGKCCGASLMTTHKEVALNLVSGILKAAEGADAVVSVCPMCQMNLESFQVQAFHMSGQKDFVTILYLPQLLGLAMDLSEDAVMLSKNMVVTDPAREKLRKANAVPG
jgi:heterodisulfide reductase subunit B